MSDFTPRPIEEVVAEVRSHPVNGLSAAEAQSRLEKDGPNELESAEPISPWQILFAQFANLMVFILLIAAVVAFVGWYLDGAHGLPGDAITISTIVVLNAVLGFLQEYRAEKTLQELKRATTAKAEVVRDGQLLSVEREQIVVGDLIQLSEGARVPADGVLVEVHRLQADESLLTGESVVVDKEPGDQVFAGTTITAGRALALITATGSRTHLGGIAVSLQSAQSEATPLEKRLDRLGTQIGWAVLVISIVVGATLLIAEGARDSKSLVHVLIFAVALAVAAVPEGLPAVLTVSLSIGARRLAARKAVVRRMAAVETLGSITAIVTDKTGTLTHNQMTVRRIFVGGQLLEVQGEGYGVESGHIQGWDQFPSEAPEGQHLAQLFLDAGVLANRSQLEAVSPEEPTRRQALGDPTDAAFLVLAEKGGRDWAKVREGSPALGEVPFSSERRRMSSVHQYGQQNLLFIKGSLEKLLTRCTHWMTTQGPVVLTEETRAQLLQSESSFSEQALRTIAVAYRSLPADAAAPFDSFECELVLLGLAGLGDPPRKEVAAAMACCHGAGISVYMLTGDHPATAVSIASQVGLTSSSRALSGAEIKSMDDAELDVALETVRVFARMMPKDKLRVVERLLARGEILAMTGDGVNDAPALKKVHVGVAMGQSGTAVAVEASDLVLLDDNFSTVVTAIQEGRGVYANVQKFICFLFSGNTGVVLAMFVGTIMAGIFNLRIGLQLLLPLTAAQILWMNLVTDGAPAVAFSLGRTEADVMKEPPRAADTPILTSSLWVYVVSTGVIIGAMLLATLDASYQGGWFTLGDHSVVLARTMGFYVVVTSRLFNALNYRSLPHSLSVGFWRDFYVPGACLLSWLMTLAILYFPPTQQIFQVTSLSLQQLAILTGFSLFILVPGEILKRVRPIQMSESAVKINRL